jgi:hypothetical protein
MGGLGDRVRPLTCRILLLPADPDQHVIDFDDAFWANWTTKNDGPFQGRSLHWGGSRSSTSSAAIRYDRETEETWGRYAAVHHCGAIELGLGTSAGWRGERHGWTGCCYLVPIVAAVWEVCHVCVRLAKLYELECPWELVVALPQTKGAVLGKFAEGWAEPGEWPYEPEPCSAPAVLIRRETTSIAADWPSTTAFSIGIQVENAFGSSHQRFRKVKDDILGDFDSSRYRG